MDRSFTHTQFCPLYRAGEPHPAHDLGERYWTNSGWVHHWCRGIGYGSIVIDRPGSPSALPAWHYATSYEAEAQLKRVRAKRETTRRPSSTEECEQ